MSETPPDPRTWKGARMPRLTTFGDRLTRLRKERGWSVSDVVEEATRRGIVLQAR